MAEYPRGVSECGDELHIDLEEFILGLGGDPEDPRDRATAERAIASVFGAEGVPIEVRGKP